MAALVPWGDSIRYVPLSLRMPNIKCIWKETTVYFSRLKLKLFNLLVQIFLQHQQQEPKIKFLGKIQNKSELVGR